MSGHGPIDKMKFVSDCFDELQKQLEARIQQEHRRRPPLMTEIVLETLAVTATTAFKNRFGQRISQLKLKCLLTRKPSACAR